MADVSPDSIQRVSLEFFDAAGRRATLEGRVVAISKDAMRLDLPPSEGALALKRGLELRVRLRDPHGDLQFVAVVNDLAMGSSVELWIRLPDHFAQLQARRFRRFDARLPAQCTRIDRAGIAREQYQVHTLEIGGKGAGILGSCGVAPGTIFLFDVDLPNVGHCQARAEVRFSHPASDGSYQWGLEFTRLEAPDLERLSEYLSALEARVG
jgi:hypothetical protein